MEMIEKFGSNYGEKLYIITVKLEILGVYNPDKPTSYHIEAEMMTVRNKVLSSMVIIGANNY